MFVPKEFDTVESLRPLSRKTNKPTTIDSGQSPTSRKQPNIWRPATYYVQAYWTTFRNNGAFALVRGEVHLAFWDFEKSEEDHYMNLEMEELLRICGRQGDRRLDGLKKDVYRAPYYLYDGKEFWSDPQRNVDRDEVYDEIVDKFGRLPEAPSGERWLVLDNG